MDAIAHVRLAVGKLKNVIDLFHDELKLEDFGEIIQRAVEEGRKDVTDMRLYVPLSDERPDEYNDLHLDVADLWFDNAELDFSLFCPELGEPLVNARAIKKDDSVWLQVMPTDLYVGLFPSLITEFTAKDDPMFLIWTARDQLQQAVQEKPMTTKNVHPVVSSLNSALRMIAGGHIAPERLEALKLALSNLPTLNAEWDDEFSNYDPYRSDYVHLNGVVQEVLLHPNYMPDSGNDYIEVVIYWEDKAGKMETVLGYEVGDTGELIDADGGVIQPGDVNAMAQAIGKRAEVEAEKYHSEHFEEEKHESYEPEERDVD